MNDAAGAEWVSALLARYEVALVRYALRMTGDLELARDIVQDTFLRACLADRAQINGHLAPWLYRVCRNRALDVMKKERRMQRVEMLEAEAQPSPAPAPREAAAGRETEALVREAIALLPVKQQEVFRLKFQDQLSYKEISEVTGFPLSNVRYLLHISLKTMRQHLRSQLELAGEVRECPPCGSM